MNHPKLTTQTSKRPKITNVLAVSVEEIHYGKLLLDHDEINESLTCNLCLKVGSVPDDSKNPSLKIH